MPWRKRSSRGAEGPSLRTASPAGRRQPSTAGRNRRPGPSAQIPPGARARACSERRRGRRRRRRRTGTPRAGRAPGRDSSLVRSMSRSAKTLSALNSAPGALCSAKASVVLSGGPSGSGSRAITMKRVMLSCEILDAGLEDVEPEDLRGARRRNRRGVAQAALPDQPRAAGRVVGRDHLDARQRSHVLLALRQRLGVREHPPDLGDRGARAARAGCGRPSAPSRRRSAARARAAGRSCDECCRRPSSRSAGCRG